MLTTKHAMLKPLIESREGIHLTAYLINCGDPTKIHSQIRTILCEADECLGEAMDVENRKKFFEPIASLLNDSRILNQMKGNIGLFRNENVFRAINIPIDVESTWQVATSFHVKPLLRWLQGDQEFIFIGLEDNEAHIYFGSQEIFKRIDTILISKNLNESHLNSRKLNLKSDSQPTISEIEGYAWTNQLVNYLSRQPQPKIFISGRPNLGGYIIANLERKNIHAIQIENSFQTESEFETCVKIRKLLKEDSNRMIKRALLEFRIAEEKNQAKKNIFQISKAVIQGKVRKLIVTDELSIFGKIDMKSGGLAIHPFDLDHEDDCILDDLAQIVLSQGGEVLIAKRDEIPKGRPILAILDGACDDSEKNETQNILQLRERLA